jgi:hypothetical protein
MSVFRLGLLIAFVFLGCRGNTAQADTYSKAVKQSCRTDYKKYCGEYGLESNALRACMDRNGNSLSKACVRALVQSGEVSQAEVNRRKKKSGR